ncbi:MAG TPA: T3SS effector HopA1 family protein [Allosphingosinicella sp.]|jgi:hypothetical protein
MGGLEPGTEAALRDIVERIALLEGGRARIASPGGEAEIGIAGTAGPVAGLVAALYAHFYCVPSPAPAAGAQPEAFLAGLRAANPVPPRLQAGWNVVQIDQSGVLLADARGAQRRASIQDVVPYAAGLVPGQPARVAVPRESVSGPGGHYVAFGRPIPEARTGRQARFYWNVPPEAAGRFLGIGAGLERRRIPFQAKVPVAPELYGRADCGVLYLALEDIEAALDLIANSASALKGSLRPATPLFARRLAPGLAFAESPPTRESFGMNRCRLVAEGLVAAFASGTRDAPGRMAAVRDRFVGYGLDPAAPERNPATRYPYRLECLAA